MKGAVDGGRIKNLICFKECFQIFLESSIFKGMHEYEEGADRERK
jgi:hypothetical protein